MKKSLGMTLAALILSGMFLTGCSSKPSEDEMKQLESLKAEVASLEQKVSESCTAEGDRREGRAVAEVRRRQGRCAETPPGNVVRRPSNSRRLCI